MAKSNGGFEISTVFGIIGLFIIFVVLIWWIFNYNRETLSQRCNRNNDKKIKDVNVV